MPDQAPRSRPTLVVHASGQAFAPGAQNALVRLGYHLVSAATAERLLRQGSLRPLLRLVDDRQLQELPLEKPGTELPILLLTGTRGPLPCDARATGMVRRPARLRDLFPLLQRALEANPRGVPRVVDAIPARASREGRHWSGLIRSLSEKGCLLEGARDLERDLRVDLSFPLASRGVMRVQAQPAYEAGPGAGLVFRGASDLARSAIADYVSSRLGG
jgi:hypothetical protein